MKASIFEKVDELIFTFNNFGYYVTNTLYSVSPLPAGVCLCSMCFRKARLYISIPIHNYLYWYCKFLKPSFIQTDGLTFVEYFFLELVTADLTMLVIVGLLAWTGKEYSVKNHPIFSNALYSKVCENGITSVIYTIIFTRSLFIIHHQF